MVRIVVFAAMLVAVATGAAAQPADVPPQCRPVNGAFNWTACLEATPANAPWRALVLVNLGTEALMRHDYANAVRYYDEAAPPGQQIYSDVTFHAFRSIAYWRVERNDDARREAQIALRMLRRDPSLPVPARTYLPAGVEIDVSYAFILPVLKATAPEQFPSAMREFMALPAADWVGYTNRSAVLQETGNLPEALQLSSRALELAPNEPSVLNNHCYIQLQLGDAEAALPYCERALAAAPQIPEVRHSMAAVYAGLGRCEEAQRELAEARRLDPATVEYQRPIACSAR
jgi:Flp pilus assembly protein TadD